MAHSSARGISRWGHLHPRTHTQPILLSEYLEREGKSRVVDNDRLTPEWKEWFDRVRAKKRTN